MQRTSHSIEPIYDVNITQAEVYAICRRHRVQPCQYRCFWRLVTLAEIKSNDFGRRIVWQTNYVQAVNEILAIVDRDFDDDTPMHEPPRSTK